MFLYGSEHALMDWHLNPDKQGAEAPVVITEPSGISTN